MNREKIREQITEMMKVEHDLVWIQHKPVDPYDRGVLDTLIKLYDEEFCYGKDHPSIYDIINDELGIDLQQLRRDKVDRLYNRVDEEIFKMVQELGDNPELIKQIRTEAYKSIDKIDITKSRNDLWDDMQKLKHKLNGMLSILYNKLKYSI